ncbi:MAG TPA: right-handed parallel beta-helix repeat-containing protein [Allosphingosinicella sp.]|nr:right-handed parallel beta-helix repeat-containing protein [Allosphingosinicella sp.]
MGRLLLLLLLLAAASAPLVAQPGDQPFSVPELGATFASLQQAVDAIGTRAGTIVIAPGRYRQCAVQEAGEIAYRAAEPGRATLDGKACEGKAALVLGGRKASVEGLVFENIRVADGNGAGIRLQQGDLVVHESLFRDSESGILSAADETGTVLVERSTFSGLGKCADDCAHAIYVGRYASLTVRRSRFERGAGGHYVKSRAARIEVTDSSFDDSAGKATNYMIDLPEGATGTIARNVFVQGPAKENYSALIVVAAEEARNSSKGLAVSDNQASLAPGQSHATAFVADLSGDALSIGANRLGPGIARFERR